MKSHKRVTNAEMAELLLTLTREVQALRANVDMLARVAFARAAGPDHTAMNLATFPSVQTPAEEPEESDVAQGFRSRLNEIYGTGWRPPAEERADGGE